MGSPVSIALLVILALICSSARAADEDETEDVYKYRVINWCITGKAERELFEWPLMQFKPYLMKTDKRYTLDDWHPNPSDDILWKDDTDPKNPTEVDPADVKATPAEPKLTFSGIRCANPGGKSTSLTGGTFHNRAHVQLKMDVNVTGVLIQAMHAPFGLGFPFGQFDLFDEFECDDCAHAFGEIIPCISRPDVEVIPPTVAIYHHQLRQFKDRKKYPKIPEEVGKKDELHFNFKWYSPPESSARHVEFWVLIVHNFYLRQFEIQKLGPYNLEQLVQKDSAKLTKKFSTTSAIDQKLPFSMPMPVFPDCLPTISSPDDPECKGKTCADDLHAMHCEATGDKMDFTEKSTSKLRMNGEFDGACVARYKNAVAGKQCDEWTGKFRLSDKKHDELDRIDEARIDRSEAVEDARFKKTFCKKCTYPSTTNTPPDDEGPEIWKRTPHAVFMMSAFFVVLPVAIIIGRFYKETYHKKECKGWRCWMWLHLFIGLGALVWAYVGYNIPTFKKLDAHMHVGYIALYLGLISFISGWFRHKDYVACTSGFHAVTGYFSWICGFASMMLVETVSRWAKASIIASFVICLLLILLLTCQVCKMDKNLGMTPKRSHFPILQVRFENVVPPGDLCRKVCLYVLMFLLTVTFFVAMFV